MKLKKLLLSALVAGALAATGASATVLTLNPSAPNVGCTDINALPCGPVGTNPAFNTDNAHIGYTGILDIASGAAIPGAVSTYAEAGNFRLLDFDLGNTLLPATTTGVNRSQTGGNYDIYAGFSMTGSGIWGGTFGTNFLTTSITSLNVTLYASPSSGTAMTLGTPTSGSAVTPAGQGITFGSEDFVLGTATIIADPTNLGTANLGLNNTGSTSLSALLQFTPAGGGTGPLTGAGGFFQAPIPFVINIGSQAGGNSLNTTWVPFGGPFGLGGGAQFRTLDNQGGGSLTFQAEPQRVPEPGSLALLGLGLAVMGFVGYRSRARA